MADIKVDKHPVLQEIASIGVKLGIAALAKDGTIVAVPEGRQEEQVSEALGSMTCRETSVSVSEIPGAMQTASHEIVINGAEKGGKLTVSGEHFARLVDDILQEAGAKRLPGEASRKFATSEASNYHKGQKLPESQIIFRTAGDRILKFEHDQRDNGRSDVLTALKRINQYLADHPDMQRESKAMMEQCVGIEEKFTDKNLPGKPAVLGTKILPSMQFTGDSKEPVLVLKVQTNHPVLVAALETERAKDPDAVAIKEPTGRVFSKHLYRKTPHVQKMGGLQIEEEIWTNDNVSFHGAKDITVTGARGIAALKGAMKAIDDREKHGALGPESRDIDDSGEFGGGMTVMPSRPRR